MTDISRAGAVFTVIRSAENGGLSERFVTESILPFIRQYAPVLSVEELCPGAALDIYTPIAAEQLRVDTIARACYARFSNTDINVQAPAARDIKLFLSDMDSTMIGQECIDELAYALGIGDDVAAITERAMCGELNFADSLLARVALLKDADVSMIDDVYRDTIHPVAGAEILLNTLRARGVYSVLVSGGFTVFAEKVAALLGFDAYHANVLETESGKLTGRITGAMVRGETKAELLRSYAKERGIACSQTLALGDGANDLPMIHTAGTGVACHAKPKVDEEAPFRIRHHDVSALLYMLGIPQSEHITEK